MILPQSHVPYAGDSPILATFASSLATLSNDIAALHDCANQLVLMGASPRATQQFAEMQQSVNDQLEHLAVLFMAQAQHHAPAADV